MQRRDSDQGLPCKVREMITASAPYGRHVCPGGGHNGRSVVIPFLNRVSQVGIFAGIRRRYE